VLEQTHFVDETIVQVL